MGTLREIFAAQEQDMTKFVDDNLNNIVNIANSRVNGDINNDEYKRRIEQVKRNVAIEKEKQRRLELVKKAMKVQQDATNGETGNPVSTEVQKQV